MKSCERSVCCLYLHFHQTHAFVNEGSLLLVAGNTILNKWVRRKYIMKCIVGLMAAFRRHCACVGFLYITRAGKLCDTWLDSAIQNLVSLNIWQRLPLTLPLSAVLMERVIKPIILIFLMIPNKFKADASIRERRAKTNRDICVSIYFNTTWSRWMTYFSCRDRKVHFWQNCYFPELNDYH